jgi:ubiquinone/menaquinone biosynthesis C-methylase UbiE
MMSKKDTNKTAWKGGVASWYKKSVGTNGSFYHREVVIPNSLRLLNIKSGEKFLDLGCGQGIMGRQIKNKYLGIDLSTELIEEAKKLDKNINHTYLVGDITKDLKIYGSFDKGMIILALQNVKKPFGVIRNFSKLLNKDGELLIVINHPAFRIPKHSDWEVVDNKQFRIMESYLSPLEIPIESSPFDKINNQISYSYHYPLSAYIEMLSDNGFFIKTIEEWISPKKSEGPMAIIEDRAREEFPLFLAIKAVKNG